MKLTFKLSSNNSKKLDEYYTKLTKPHRNKIWRFFKRFFNYEKFDCCWNKQQINTCTVKWSETQLGRENPFYLFDINVSQDGKHLFCISSNIWRQYDENDIARLVTILYDRFPDCKISVMTKRFVHEENCPMVQGALDRQIDMQRLEKTREKKVKKLFDHARAEHDQAFGTEGNQE